jgi:hypothetical protein
MRSPLELMLLLIHASLCVHAEAQHATPIASIPIRLGFASCLSSRFALWRPAEEWSTRAIA